MWIIIFHLETWNYLFALPRRVLTHTNLSGAHTRITVWSVCLQCFFFLQAAVKSMQHASRSLCTFICIPAVCPSLHSANARLLIMFQNPKAFGKALITPKAHKPLFDLFFSYVTFSIALFFFVHSSMPRWCTVLKTGTVRLRASICRHWLVLVCSVPSKPRGNLSSTYLVNKYWLSQ